MSDTHVAVNKIFHTRATNLISEFQIKYELTIKFNQKSSRKMSSTTERKRFTLKLVLRQSL